MREQKIRYADAGMDIKKLVLCFAKRIWLAAAAGAAGAVIGGLVYLMVSVVPEAEREYQAMSKIYLDFAPDETGEVYQAYNGYTWNDLMATDPILDVTMQYLPKTYSREEVTGATKAEILSDLRLLTITVTTHDADSCNAILQATGQSLTDRGREAKEFHRIEVIQTTEAALVVADSRLVQAVLIGLVLGAVTALLGMLLYYVLDDRIMVAADLRQVTDVPFVGYGGAGGQPGADGLRLPGQGPLNLRRGGVLRQPLLRQLHQLQPAVPAQPLDVLRRGLGIKFFLQLANADDGYSQHGVRSRQ